MYQYPNHNQAAPNNIYKHATG